MQSKQYTFILPVEYNVSTLYKERKIFNHYFSGKVYDITAKFKKTLELEEKPNNETKIKTSLIIQEVFIPVDFNTNHGNEIVFI